MANYLDYDGLTTYDSTLKTYDSTDVKMNGTRAVGTSKKCARADHVHPTDTSRAPLASPAFTGTPTAPTAATGTNTTQIATTAFVQDALGGNLVNCFYRVKVGPSYVTADSSADTIELIAGDNIELTANASDDSITIDAYDTTYADFTGATTSVNGTHGLVPQPLSGSQNAVLLGSSNWAKLSGSTSYSSTGVSIKIDKLMQGESTTSTLLQTGITNATSSTPGCMSAADKSKLDGFSSASDYALKTDITGIYKYKGSVATESNLPSSNLTAGDVYNIEAESTYGPAGTNVAWVAASGNVAAHWDALGGAFTITSITTAQINALFA